MKIRDMRADLDDSDVPEDVVARFVWGGLPHEFIDVEDDGTIRTKETFAVLSNEGAAFSAAVKAAVELQAELDSE